MPVLPPMLLSLCHLSLHVASPRIKGPAQKGPTTTNPPTVHPPPPPHTPPPGHSSAAMRAGQYLNSSFDQTLIKLPQLFLFLFLHLSSRDDPCPHSNALSTLHLSRSNPGALNSSSAPQQPYPRDTVPPHQSYPCEQLVGPPAALPT